MLSVVNIGYVKYKLTLALAFAVLALAIHSERVQADDYAVCTPVYGGGQICGARTPVATGAETDILYTLSAVLYTTGLGSFIVAKKADKLIPFLG